MQAVRRTDNDKIQIRIGTKLRVIRIPLAGAIFVGERLRLFRVSPITGNELHLLHDRKLCRVSDAAHANANQAKSELPILHHQYLLLDQQRRVDSPGTATRDQPRRIKIAQTEQCRMVRIRFAPMPSRPRYRDFVVVCPLNLLGGLAEAHLIDHRKQDIVAFARFYNLIGRAQ